MCRFATEMGDISLGREAVEVTADPKYLDTILALPFTYINRNVDSDDTQSTMIAVDKLPACSCSYNGDCSPRANEGPCSCSQVHEYTSLLHSL